MAESGAWQNETLVNEIVQRVLLQLQQDGATNQTESAYRFAGRLLTSEVLRSLPVTKQLIISSRCVITPEVRDLLRNKGVQLTRSDAGQSDAIPPASATDQVWLLGPCPAWIQQWLKPANESDCYQKLADAVFATGNSELATGRKQRNLVLVTRQDPLAGYQVQQALCQKGAFAMLLSLDDEAALQSMKSLAPETVIVRPPMMSWSLRRLLQLWSPSLGETG